MFHNINGGIDPVNKKHVSNNKDYHITEYSKRYFIKDDFILCKSQRSFKRGFYLNVDKQ